MKIGTLANELADYITKNVAQAVQGSATAATMLRQQQAEIEALKDFLKANQLYLSYVEWRHAK